MHFQQKKILNKASLLHYDDSGKDKHNKVLIKDQNLLCLTILIGKLLMAGKTDIGEHFSNGWTVFNIFFNISFCKIEFFAPRNKSNHHFLKF
jgi:hypothetical protein